MDTSKKSSISLKDIDGSVPFISGLEYNPPARGVWNIVHIGMTLPESHILFICPAGCMRGVVLSAAEMGAQDRFSALLMTEEDVLDGDGERLIIDGASEVIESLPIRPKAMLIFTNCTDLFLGTDHEVAYGELRKKYPDIGFIECFMNPTMRKTAPPDPLMRKQLFNLLEPVDERQRAVNFIGNNVKLSDDNEFVKMISDAGYKVLEIGRCKTFSDYQEMASSVLDITVNPSGESSLHFLTERLGIPELYIPIKYDFEEIEADIELLARQLDIDKPDLKIIKRDTEEALRTAASHIKGAPIVIDFTFTSRPFGLAKLLKIHGFNVAEVISESCSQSDLKDLEWLKENAGDIIWSYHAHHEMAEFGRRGKAGNRPEVLAIGQMAAYFSGTSNFVNVIDSDGLYGFHGIRKLSELIIEAADNIKDTEKVIQIKGLGCCL